MIGPKNKVFIISEVHPQHNGCIEDLELMILQSKMAGASAVKLQLYDPLKLQKDPNKLYLQIDFDELLSIKKYCDLIKIDLFASVFDHERFDWCEELKFKYHKVASRIKDTSLVEKMVTTRKTCFISNNDFTWVHFDNVKYLYCVPEYPTFIENIEMPNSFMGQNSKFSGISDHSFGTTACICAIARGAKYIEKHFTISKGMQSNSEKAHLGSMDFNDLQQIKKFSLDACHII